MGLLAASRSAAPPLLTQQSSDGCKPLLIGGSIPLLADHVPRAPSTATEGVCQLCFEAPKRAAVASCYHQFCHSCVLQACATGLGCCPHPECRVPIREIKVLGLATDDPKFVRTLEMPKGTHAGITLAGREPYDRGPGVAVTGLVKRDQAYICGLRVGDVILSIGGEPIHEPAEGTRLINAITSSTTAAPLRQKGGKLHAKRATLIILPQADVGYEPPRLGKQNSSSRSLPVGQDRI